MAVLLPLRLGRMQAALVAAFGSILGSGHQIRWAHAQKPRPAVATDIVNLQMIQGPSHVDSIKDQAITAELPTSTEITISGVTVGARYWVEINGYPYSYDAQGGNDKDDVRDELIIAINATDAEETATASSGGSGKVALSPDVPGGIYSIEVSPTAQMSVAHGGTEFIRLVTGTRLCVISVQAFAHSKILTESAEAIIAKIKSGLDLESVRSVLLGAGVSIWAIGNTVDLTAIAGSEFESRAQFDLTLAQRAVLTEQLSTIENVEFTLQGTTFTHP